MGETFYWHDYETWGADPRRDRAAQFAGVRTDQEFRIRDVLCAWGTATSSRLRTLWWKEIGLTNASIRSTLRM